MWVAETTKSHNRGYLVCMEAAMVAGGTVIAYWVDFGLSYVPSSVAWRVPIALQIGVYLTPAFLQRIDRLTHGLM